MGGADIARGTGRGPQPCAGKGSAVGRQVRGRTVVPRRASWDLGWASQQPGRALLTLRPPVCPEDVGAVSWGGGPGSRVSQACRFSYRRIGPAVFPDPQGSRAWEQMTPGFWLRWWGKGVSLRPGRPVRSKGTCVQGGRKLFGIMMKATCVVKPTEGRVVCSISRVTEPHICGAACRAHVLRPLEAVECGRFLRRAVT